MKCMLLQQLLSVFTFSLPRLIFFPSEDGGDGFGGPSTAGKRDIRFLMASNQRLDVKHLKVAAFFTPPLANRLFHLGLCRGKRGTAALEAASDSEASPPPKAAAAELRRSYGSVEAAHSKYPATLSL